ncbi:MAG: ABC transporter permease [Bacteroides sp.]|nr:ABC transporter permease [Bacteroides sp.]
MAAMNGVDFSGLFLTLGFFIILSAGMLMSIPLAEMLYRRRREIDLLQSFGYRNGKIIRNLWLESAPVVFFASLAGVVIGILYTTLVVWLLGTVWKGATRTDGFMLLPNLYTVGIGLLTGIILAMAILRISIGRSIRRIGAPVRLKVTAVRRKPGVVIAASLLTILLIGINLFTIASVTLFVVGRGLLLVTTALWGDYFLVSRGGIRQQAFTSSKLVWATLYAHRKQICLSYFTLAIGVFIVFSVGLNRQGFTDSTRLAGGTGGYTLWGESTVPLYHNLATEAGRERLALTGLPAETDILQCLRYSADEASCLNLNKVVIPSVLGVDMQALEESSLGVNKNIYRADRHTLFEKLTQTEEGIYPALVDETVLLWSLGMKLGDTIRYEGNNGKKVTVRLVGTLDNTIFQGYLLIDKKLFSGIWEEITGSEVILLKVPEAEKETVKNLLSRALHEYGIRVTTTQERLKEFNSVTDTYLSIFMTLGGIGLLLVVMSFVIVVRKNLVMRRGEIGLYRTLGFTDERIEKILCHENLLVPLYAIFTGIMASFVGVSGGIAHVGTGVWLIALFFALLLILCTGVFIKREVKKRCCMLIYKDIIPASLIKRRAQK